MTYAEARQIMRKHYDMWSAAANLHEVLEKAAEAETFLSRSKAAVAESETRLNGLETQFQEKTVLYQATLESMEADLRTRRSDNQARLVADLAEMETQRAAAQAAAQAEMDQMAQRLAHARVTHAAAMESMQATALQARDDTTKLVEEREHAKARYAALFG
mgnify:CR=1 FL=1